ncbi:hypothetical protein TTHERM_00442390 (macronuclear) [Tetrahymena thermophila SB210]|uniref:Uncharacterized protein n=1 Tax=Tetrahymena thermophila (strain SB210) TaxID=312017 RepID=I7MGV1_TETTS|nr:hypothetical protein TTHERM_00442390 [Tetrahymena thermophila SB210]EAR85489.2 hypothetical protein TTHERM_00442390 [Tetrahymena thermophila SB210]|eukprot:XP_001033152.2 hypothetical protein TTHERM_00442390 [Tetrahymena thermophila SB210]
MKKGDKTLEEELEEDNPDQQELDFDLYNQGSVGFSKMLDNDLEKKESSMPGLNKFVSIYAPIPIRREKSFQYLIDPTLNNSNSVINNSGLPQQIANDNFSFEYGTSLEVKDDDLKGQDQMPEINRNQSNNYFYNNYSGYGYDNAWVDIDDNNLNQEENDIKSSNLIRSKSNLNRDEFSLNQKQQSNYGGSLIQQKDNNNQIDDDDQSDIQEIKPEIFIQIESSKNLKDKNNKKQVIQISDEDEQQKEEELEIFSDDREEQKKSTQSLQSLKMYDLQTMEEEKRKKIVTNRRNNGNISRELIDLEEDQEKQDNYKLTQAEEYGIVSNMNEWMNLSRNNMKLRILNRKYQAELNRERSVHFKKAKNNQDIFDKMKKKMKKLITSNQQLVDSNNEMEKRYKETAQQFQRVTTELAEKQLNIQDLNRKLIQHETSLVEYQSSLQNKDNEILNLKNTIQIYQQANQNIYLKRTQLDTAELETNLSIQRAFDTSEIKKKIDQLNQELGEKQSELSSSNDMFQIFCFLHKKLLSMKEENLNKSEQISQLQQFQQEKTQFELRARLAEDELGVIKKNNYDLSQLLSEKENKIQTLLLQVSEIERLQERNLQLIEEKDLLQQQKTDKERLLMEQEVIHQIKIDNLMDAIKNQEQKINVKKQLNELMDISQIASSSFVPEHILANQNVFDNNSNELTKVKIDRKSLDLNDECVLLKNTLLKLFNWEIQYDNGLPFKFNLVNKSNPNKKQLSINLAVNEEGEIEIQNKKYLLKNVRKLWKMLDQDLHMSSLRSCVENFWLITSLQLKEYLTQEEQEFNKQMEIQSQNDIAQRDYMQEDIEQDEQFSCSSSESSYSENLEQEDTIQDIQNKSGQVMDLSYNQMTANKLQEEDEEDIQENLEEQENIQEEGENNKEFEDGEAINDEDCNNFNIITNKNNINKYNLMQSQNNQQYEDVQQLK